MGIRTARAERQRRLKVNHPHGQHAEDYEPTPAGVLDDILCGLDLDPSTYTFVDLGAGKGRVLCLASAHPFRRIVGVELVPTLVRACRDNLAAFDAPWARCRQLECVEADASAYALPTGPVVVYMYNPFRPPVLRRVQRRLIESFIATPRPIWVLYYMPVHRRHLDEDPSFDVVDEDRDWIAYRLVTGHRT